MLNEFLKCHAIVLINKRQRIRYKADWQMRLSDFFCSLKSRHSTATAIPFQKLFSPYQMSDEINLHKPCLIQARLCKLVATYMIYCFSSYIYVSNPCIISPTNCPPPTYRLNCFYCKFESCCSYYKKIINNSEGAITFHVSSFRNSESELHHSVYRAPVSSPRSTCIYSNQSSTFSDFFRSNRSILMV